MITSPHWSYITPNKVQINSYFRGMGFNGTYSPSFVQEICNAYSHYMCGGTIQDSFTGEGSGYGEKYDENVKAFLSTLDYSYEGRSPMAKALTIVASIYNTQREKNNSLGENGSDDDSVLPLFSDGDSDGSKLANAVNNDFDRLEKLMPTGSYTEKTINGDSKFKSVAMSSIPDDKLRVLNKLARLKRYDSDIEAHKEITWKINPMSTDTKLVPLTDFAQSLKVSPVQRAMPHYKYKLATKQVIPKEHIKYTVKKQCLAFLIDDSGSMSCNYKIEWVKALLLNRIEQVIKGEAELYICTFEEELDSDQWIVIRNQEDADNVMDKFRTYFQFDRGTTDIECAVTTAIEQIKSGVLKSRFHGDITIDSVKPQICVINDGDDFISPSFVPDVVTHGFILGTHNPNMMKMCDKSGGIYEEFNS